MPKTQAEIRRQLGVIESDERMFAGLGPEDVDVLKALLDDEEAWLAARSVHALSRIDADDARAAVRAAAGSSRMELRTAAAVAAPRLPTDLSDAVLGALLKDTSAAVRKFAVAAVSDRNSPAVRRQIDQTATTDPNLRLRGIARNKADDLGTNGAQGG